MQLCKILVHLYLIIQNDFFLPECCLTSLTVAQNWTGDVQTNSVIIYYGSSYFFTFHQDMISWLLKINTKPNTITYLFPQSLNFTVSPSLSILNTSRIFILYWLCVEAWVFWRYLSITYKRTEKKKTLTGSLEELCKILGIAKDIQPNTCFISGIIYLQSALHSKTTFLTIPWQATLSYLPYHFPSIPPISIYHWISSTISQSSRDPSKHHIQTNPNGSNSFWLKHHACLELIH